LVLSGDNMLLSVMRETLGARIAKLCALRGITEYQLAKLVGISTGTLSNIKRRGAMNSRMLTRFAEALNVPAGVVLALEDIPDDVRATQLRPKKS
jgi:transcriptional regulator with XRE-family HTH domain